MLQQMSELTLWREGVYGAVLLASALVGWRLIAWAVRQLARRLRLPPLSLRPLSVFGRFLLLLAVAGALANRYLGLDVLSVVGGFLAIMGIGFVAVWSTLSSVLCAALILAQRPFRLGDELEFLPEGIKGRVTDLNLFFTTLEEPDGRLVQIPNNQFFQRIVHRRVASQWADEVRREHGGSQRL